MKNTSASHKTRFQCMMRPYPHSSYKVVGQGNMMENYNQGSYIESKKVNCDIEGKEKQFENRLTKAQKYLQCATTDSIKLSSNNGPCSN